MAAKSSTKKTTDARVGPMPLRYGNDPLLWTCWLYYEEGMTQNDIAKTMGMSRGSVNSYLAEARTQGIVDISIEHEKLRTLSVAKALKDYYGLKDCLVIPGEGGDRSLVDRLGTAGAQVLTNYIKSGDSIGIGWGRTIRSLAARLDNLKLQDLTVIQTVGAAATDHPYSPELCASLFARNIGARCIQLSVPAIVSSGAVREILENEAIVSRQLATLSTLNKIVFGVSSLRPNSTIHSSVFFEGGLFRQEHYHGAIVEILGRFVDEMGKPVIGALEERTLSITLDQLAKVEQRIAVAGGIDKVPAILATLRGGHANVLITDAATGWGILTAEGQQDLLKRGSRKLTPQPIEQRSFVKKLINDPADTVNEALEGAVSEHSKLIEPINGSNRALKAINGPRPGKVGLVIGGGSGHEPCFFGYVGKGMVDAVAIGDIFASPPPGPILDCTLAVANGAGVLYIFGNYSGDVLNFQMAADQAKSEGIDVRIITTTDDIASASFEDKDSRRGVAGSTFVYKIAGAACDQMMSLADCEAVARKTNGRTFTVGITLEPCSLPETQRPSFKLGGDEIEVGVGVHGEPGVSRQKFTSADDSADLMIEKILVEMKAERGDQIALLVNSLGGTPLMELYILNRRVRQRLAARGIEVYASWTGHYCTSLDMVGASISILHLDKELKSLLDHPCETPFFQSKT
ncbi:MAG: 3,4-dihydroxy-2-butanone kinase [Hyphomicrobiales bacterium]|nr:MAG: 3,4-dihydroxy-2-butanone kinase [Hyphomicrobiales bacterium]